MWLTAALLVTSTATTAGCLLELGDLSLELLDCFRLPAIAELSTLHS